jgi:hypothetical protein
MLVRPRGIAEVWWVSAGAIALVLLRLLPLPVAAHAVAKGSDVYLFLAGMMLLSEIARGHGVFDWMSSLAVRSARGSSVRLFTTVYAVGTVVTIFMSNDVTAVVLTPAILVAVRKAKDRSPSPSVRLRVHRKCRVFRAADLEPRQPRRLSGGDALPWPLARRVRASERRLDRDDLRGPSLRLPPGALASTAVTAGDSVDVQGDQSVAGPVQLVERATISRGGTVLTSAEPPPPPSPGRGRGPAADAALQPMSASGAIHAVLYNREGIEDGLLLDDGTTARVPPNAALERLNLKVGDRVTIQGRGTASGVGRGLRAETIAVANGTTVVVDTPPPVPSPVSQGGTVQRLFVNPHGDVDVILLSDGNAVRVPPTPSAIAAKLRAGQAVHIEGEIVGAALHATQVRLPSGEVVAAEPTAPPPPPPPPDTMLHVDDTSTIAGFLRGPRGEVDALMLADGTIARLPRRLSEETTAVLAIGVRIHVEGEGGRYPLGTSLRADTLRLDSGQVFTDPGPVGPRFPPPAFGAPPPPPAP